MITTTLHLLIRPFVPVFSLRSLPRHYRFFYVCHLPLRLNSRRLLDYQADFRGEDRASDRVARVLLLQGGTAVANHFETSCAWMLYRAFGCIRYMTKREHALLIDYREPKLRALSWN